MCSQDSFTTVPPKAVKQQTLRFFALCPRVARIVSVYRQHPYHDRGELLHRREMRGLIGHQMLHPSAELSHLRLRIRMELHDKGSVVRKRR